MINPTIFFATGLYLVFVIYGSLVPLVLNDLSIEAALTRFKNIPYLNLGAESRADWIANIVLYIPLSFLASAIFNRANSLLARLSVAILVLAFCLLVAVAVEFTQLFFPPRTVSLNDLSAEALGSLIGVLSWLFLSDYFSGLWRQLVSANRLSVQSAIIFYILIYGALSLFPYDFVTSIAELNLKLAHSSDSIFMSFSTCQTNGVRCGLKILSEIAVLLPLGLLCGYLPSVQQRITIAVLLGFLIGLVLELIQVFLLSGSGQGLSIITRMIGMGLGASLWSRIQTLDVSVTLRYLKRSLTLIIPLYLLLLITANGELTHHWLLPQLALERLTDINFLPLYYFYYTSEGVALVSLLNTIGLYFPIGLFCWLGFIKKDYLQHPPTLHWFFVGLLAGFVALAIETGKLFLVAKHPDPSNIWLAFMAAAACYQLMSAIPSWLFHTKNTIPTITIALLATTSEHTQQQVLPAFEADKRWRIVSLLLWSLIMVVLFDYPVAPFALGLFLLGYSTLLAYLPYAWLIVIPALLPVMDFAPWTGRFFFDEFDLLILTTLAYYFWHKPKHAQRSLLIIPSILLLTIFTVLYGISLLKGLLPLPVINANAFNHYYSHFNSLRVGKGYLWSLLLLPFLQLTLRRYRDTPYYFGYGILLGLAGVCIFAIIERLVFVSLFDFSSDYRINALFSSMHTGGGHIESYLMLTLPFITLLFNNDIHHKNRWVLGILLFIISIYTLLVTFSRGGYLGFCIGFLVLLFTLLIGFKRPKKYLLPLSLLAIGALMALPVLRGSYIQQRFDEYHQDQNSRSVHWQDALFMRDDNIATSLFGMGLGTYPRTFFWLNNEKSKPASYEIITEKDQPYLRLSGGDALFFGQYIAVKSHTAYRLLLDIRSKKLGLNLSTSLCEKSLQYALRCSTELITTDSSEWKQVEHLIDSHDLGESVTAGLLKRPIQLSFYNSNGIGQALDIDHVQLLNPEGINLIENGDFSRSTDFWLFATEKHNPWHIFNLWVHLLFDQGWLGLCVFILLFSLAIHRCCRLLPQQAIYSSILLSAFSGFLVVAWVDSPFDAPRLTLLFFLLLFLALLRTPQVWKTAPIL
jgi:VanZ family protein